MSLIIERVAAIVRFSIALVKYFDQSKQRGKGIFHLAT